MVNIQSYCDLNCGRDCASTTLIYAHDPMCSWCWGFRPNYEKLLAQLPAEFNVSAVVGGLAADSDAPMPLEMQQYLQQTWQTIAQQIAGTQFNFEFWSGQNKPRRSTYPACRAVIAARLQGSHWDEKMTKAIQEAYYLQARNPSDNETLIAIAGELGMQQDEFANNLVSDEVARLLHKEIDFVRRIGVQGFPSLRLVTDGAIRSIGVDYREVQPMLDAILR